MRPYNVNEFKAAKEAAVQSLLRPNFQGNVVGVGIGKKVKGGKVTGIDCLRIYVQAKRGLDYVMPAAVIPSGFLDIPTDVIQVGRLGRAGRRKDPRDDGAPDVKGPGSSLRLDDGPPNVNQGAGGTLGAFVRDKAKGTLYILSCNHVLAANGRVRAHPATVAVSPALSHKPWKLAKAGAAFFVKLTDQANGVDCAIALLEKAAAGCELDPRFRAAADGKLAGTLPPSQGQRVKKDGAVTGLTAGTVVDTGANLFVECSFGTFLFTDQVVIEGDDDNFAADGDSGSVVIEEKQNAIAMVFAGSGRFAIACPIDAVLARLGALAGADLELVSDFGGAAGYPPSARAGQENRPSARYNS